MDPQRWQAIEALFHQARSLDGAQRQKLLDARRDEGSDLIDEVEAMLQADEPSSAELGGIVESAIFGALEQLPDQIGPYEVVSQVGTGGFCSVYLARLPQEPAQRVALKVLRRGLASPETESRLRQESEILARLHHPNIAELLGHGTSRHGEPYFVMELIDGEPIDRFCDRQRWTIDQRLQLFRQVCAAVDYAHANLVIHRDIKPSNLLVTQDGTPKLLDFGIAKLLLPELSRADPVHTVAGNSWMTPDFASPEQVREEPLTTATDVYSLGVLLYRLLCGRPPYRFASRSPRAIENVISNVEPAAPSALLATELPASAMGQGEASVSTSAEDLAHCRQMTVAQLRSRLRGDLDSIVLMALSKQPDQRYSSVQQLSQDIARHLNSQPVSARPITALYRARKFVRRHRVAVGIAAAILTIMSTAVVVTTLATLRAEAERNRAERHLAESQVVTNFLVDIFEVPDPEITQGREITVKELLDEGAKQISTQLQHQPEIRSALMATMGRVYRNLGDHQKSRELLEESLAYRRQHHGQTAPMVIETLHELARSLLVQGEYETARTLLKETQTTLQQAGNHATAPYAVTLALLAAAHRQMNQLDEAESLTRQALEIQRALLAPTDPALIDSISKLAEVLSQRQDLGAAEEMFRETLELRRSALGDRHPDVATSLGNLTFVLHGQGRLDEAEQTAREAMAIRAELYGDNHWIVGNSYNNLSQVLAAKGQFVDALPWMEKAAEIGRQRLGQDHPKVIGNLVNLAQMYQRVDRLQEAEDLYLQALQLHQRTLGEQHPSTARNLFQLASLYVAQKRGQEALPLLDRVVSVFSTAIPKDDSRWSYPLLLRGRIYAELGDCSKALPDLNRALKLRRNEHPSDHPSVAEITTELERCDASIEKP